MKKSIVSSELNGLGGLCSNDESAVAQWHHMNYTSASAKSWLKGFGKVSEQAKIILLASETRPRTVIDNDETIICLRGINLNKNASPEDMISIRVWFNQDTLITSCNRNSQSLIRVLQQLEAGRGAQSIAELVNAIIEQLAHLTDEFIDSMESTLDKEEDLITEARFESFNPRMSQLRRQMATIRRYLAPQKEALDKLYRTKSTVLGESFYDGLYIQLDKFIHLLENLDLMRERVLVLQEQFLAYISHQQNSRLYLLAIVSAIFLPLTFLSGLLGMNVGGLPGLESPVAFWLVSGFCLVVAVALLVWFKRKQWF